MVTNIALLNPGSRENIATALRSSQNLNVSSVCIIGGVINKKYKGNIHKFRHQMDTQDGAFNVPLYYFESLADFLKHLPAKTTLVVVEMTEQAKAIEFYEHPKNATYLFGTEISGISKEDLKLIEKHFNELNADIPSEYLKDNKETAHLDYIKISTPASLNLGVCASIIMYDRNSKNIKMSLC